MRGAEMDHQHLERLEKKVKASKGISSPWRCPTRSTIPKINTLFQAHHSPSTYTAVYYNMTLFYVLGMYICLSVFRMDIGLTFN